MDKEAFDLPKTPDHTNSPAFHPTPNIYPLFETHIPSQSFFSRFVKKVGQIFNKAPEVHDIRLGGRIKELKKIADGLCLELLDFKNKLKEELDPALYALVIPIITPLIKESGCPPPLAEKKDTTVHSVKLFSRYVETIEKAKMWVELGKQNENDLEQAVIRQTAQEFVCRIDRDIQIIQEYLKNILTSLGMEEDLDEELKKKLMPGLDVNLEKLKELKKFSSQFSLASFIEWRSHSDRDREALFGTSLHVIDQFADEFLPHSGKEGDTEESKALCDELNRMENKVSKAAEEIENRGILNEEQKKSYLILIEKLEREAHEFNTNLFLDTENSERIDSLLEILFHLREKL